MQRFATLLLLLAACADDDSGSGNAVYCYHPSRIPGFAVEGGVALTNVLPPVAVGGTMVIRPRCVTNYDGNVGQFGVLAGGYAVDTGDDPAVLARVVGDHIEVEGLREGTNDMRIFGPAVDEATFPVRARNVDSIQLVPLDMELAVPDADPSDAFAWATGTHEFSLTIRGGGENVFDINETATSPNALIGPKPDWPGQFTINSIAAGSFPISAHAGTFVTDVPIAFVAGADMVVADDPSTVLVAGEEPRLCFAAYSQGRRVLGLMWTFETDNGTLTGQWNQCTWVKTTADQAGQTVMLTVRASGMTLTKTYSLM